MNFSDEEIKRQMHLGEDSHWKFKEIVFAGDDPKSPRRDDLADELAAFAKHRWWGGAVWCNRQRRCPRHVAQADGCPRATLDRSLHRRD